MAKYNIGDRVINYETQDKGVIITVHPPKRGRQMYTVMYHSGDSDELEQELLPDINLRDLFDRCKQNIYGSYEDFLLTNTTFKIQNSNNNSISSLKASKTIFKGYQYKPLLKFVNSDSNRVLIADEVGLGKTIEAGHILSEIKARGELKNALIVCPKSLQEKWKTELQEKFGIVFKIYAKVDDLINDIKDYNGSVRAIVNYEKIRIKRGDKSKQEDKITSNRKKRADLLSILDEGKRFDLIICDEAHKLRNHTTLTYQGMQNLVRPAAAVIFLTATPIMISDRNLYNLLHLLDEYRFSEYQMFENTLQANKPFIKALSMLNNSIPLEEIADFLQNETVVIRTDINERVIVQNYKLSELNSDIRLYGKILDDCYNGEDSPHLRARLQYDISSLSPMNNIFSRTRKRDVTTDLSQAERKPHTRRVTLKEHERELFDKIISQYEDDNSYVDWNDDVKMLPGTALGLVQKKRRVASSVYASESDTRDLVQGIDKYAHLPDAKVEELLSIIDEVFTKSKRKIIVFALFKDTIKYLAIRLKKAGYNSLYIDGDIDNRSELLAEFRDNDNVQIFLSSEVGSEGLDMQFCNTMVNYDLPWNPMVVEQRIGRIDRFGQESPVVNIYNIIVKDSIQEQIYSRLLERIGIFKESIGDLEAILDKELEIEGLDCRNISQLFSKVERTFYCTELTPSEIEIKLSQIQRAIETEKENLKSVEDGLNNTLTNDVYFKSEINRILRRNAYVSEAELVNYINLLIRKHLTLCSLSLSENNECYNITLPASQPTYLTNFLCKYTPNNDEAGRIFRSFSNTLSGKNTLEATFSQEYAYRYKHMMYMNIYNPIVIAAAKYFSQEENSVDGTFRFELSSEGLKLPRGRYFICTYIVDVCKVIHNKEQHSESVHPVLYNLSTQKVIDDNEQVELMFGRAQVDGTYWSGEFNESDVESIENMRYEVKDSIEGHIQLLRDDIEMRLSDMSTTQRKRISEYYTPRKENYMTLLEQYRIEKSMLFSDDVKRDRELTGAIRLTEFNLNALISKESAELDSLSHSTLQSIKPRLVSISYINLV